MKPLVYGDLIFSTVHGCYVRFVQHDGIFVVVMDRNSLSELPDLVHISQIRQM